MVGIEQACRFTVPRGAARDDGRSTRSAVGFRDAQDADVVHSSLANQGRNGLRAPVQFGRVEAGPGNPGYGHKILQGGKGGVKPVVDSLGQGLGVDTGDGLACDRGIVGVPLLGLRDLRMF